MRSIGDSLSSLDQSPFQTPDVSGCSTPASRAQSNTCGSSASTRSTLFFGSCAAVAVRVHVVGLVPDVPAEHARVLAEGADDARDVRLEPRILLRILQRLRAGSLQPAGVVHARRRLVLLAQMRIRIPARIEEHEQRLDVVLRGDVEEAIDPLAITRRRPAATADRAGTPSSSSCRALRPSRAPCRSCCGSNVSACHISSSLIAVAGM